MNRRWLTGSLHWRLLRALSAWEYGRLVPASGRWPLPLGRTIARLRGWLNARFDCDWKTVSVQQHFLTARLADTFAQISTARAQNRESLRQLMRQRFTTAAREEWEAVLTVRGRLGELRVSFENINPLLERRAHGRGVVLLTAHFDSTLLGVSCLGRFGVPIHLATSNVVLDPAVPVAIQSFFTAKYEAMQRHFNGGRYAHVETHLKSLYAALQRGEWVVILGDSPGAPDARGLGMPFFGRIRLFAPGPIRMARSVGADMVAMVCLFKGGNDYEVVLSEVESAAALAEPQAAERLYGFLENHIGTFPGRWWAAEQLPEFPIAEQAHAI